MIYNNVMQIILHCKYNRYNIIKLYVDKLYYVVVIKYLYDMIR